MAVTINNAIVMERTNLQVGSIIKKGICIYVVYDWCPPCNLIWCEFWGERFKLKYSEVELISL